MSLSHRGRRVEILPASPDAAAPEAGVCLALRTPRRRHRPLRLDIIDDPAARSKGTLILKLKNGILIGEWVRISLKAGLSAGDIVLAKDRETAQPDGPGAPRICTADPRRRFCRKRDA